MLPKTKCFPCRQKELCVLHFSCDSLLPPTHLTFPALHMMKSLLDIWACCVKKSSLHARQPRGIHHGPYNSATAFSDTVAFQVDKMMQPDSQRAFCSIQRLQNLLFTEMSEQSRTQVQLVFLKVDTVFIQWRAEEVKVILLSKCLTRLVRCFLLFSMLSVFSSVKVAQNVCNLFWCVCSVVVFQDNVMLLS